MTLLVLLLIFPTLDSHFVSTNHQLLTLTLTHLYLLPDLMTLLVLLLIFPTLDSHSNSFVSTSLTVNLPDLMTLLVLLLIFPTLDSHSNSFVSTA